MASVTCKLVLIKQVLQELKFCKIHQMKLYNLYAPTRGVELQDVCYCLLECSVKLIVFAIACQ